MFGASSEIASIMEFGFYLSFALAPRTAYERGVLSSNFEGREQYDVIIMASEDE